MEVTGKVGDVFILHPFMLHSASRNLRRNVRIITNAAVSLKEPFNFNRPDPKDYSLVEKKTLLALGRPEGIPSGRLWGSGSCSRLTTYVHSGFIIEEVNQY